MSTNVQAVINAAADEADSLLEGIAKPAEARPLLLEWLGDNHPELPHAEQETVVAQVLLLLQREGFFAVAASSEDSADAMEASEADE